MSDSDLPRFFVPFHCPELIGREDDLQRLHDAMAQGNTAVTPALSGQGGVGKTQLAVAYCYRHARDYPGGVFWLNAGDPGGLVGQMGDYPTQLGLEAVDEASSEAEYRRRRALQWMGTVRGRTDPLVVLDNLDDDALLRQPIAGLGNERITGLGCRSLITSRRRELLGCEALPVDSLSPGAARELLLRESGRTLDTAEDETAFGDILDMLGGLPLALRLIGARLKRGSKSLPETVAMLREKGAVSMTDHRKLKLDDYQRSVNAVLVESWNGLPTDQPELRAVLQAMACLPVSRQIPEFLVRAMVDLGGEDDDDLDDPLGELVDRSLLERPAEGMLRLHPLIHEYAGAQCPAGFAERVTDQVMRSFLAPDFLRAQSSANFLVLLDALVLLPDPTTSTPGEIHTLAQLQRLLTLQAHHLRQIDRPLPQLYLNHISFEMLSFGTKYSIFMLP